MARRTIRHAERLNSEQAEIIQHEINRLRSFIKDAAIWNSGETLYHRELQRLEALMNEAAEDVPAAGNETIITEETESDG